jgi:hypothetical protein
MTSRDGFTQPFDPRVIQLTALPEHRAGGVGPAPWPARRRDDSIEKAELGLEDLELSARHQWAFRPAWLSKAIVH